MKNIIIFLALQWMAYGEVFLVFGGNTGWIGQKMVTLLKEKNHTVIGAESRLENREEILLEIERVKPDRIINAAGVTGRPNVDWCEDHKIETIRANIIGALNLIDVAYLKGIHVTNFGTGCIYEYDENHPIGVGFTEEDPPNFAGSFYSKSKGMLDPLMQCYPNLLNLRLRMPISEDLHARSLITKITSYKKVINIPNSMSVLSDLLPIAVDMSLKQRVGNYNFCNPGAITHNEILQLYKKYVDPNFSWGNFTIDDQNQVLKAKRSNNELDVTKLLKEYPEITSIQESIKKILEHLFL